MEVMERGPHAAATAGYRPGLRLSRVFHLHQACMDHPRLRYERPIAGVSIPALMACLRHLGGPFTRSGVPARRASWHPLRRILQLVDAGRSPVTIKSDPLACGGGPSPSPSWEFPGADPATGLTSFSKALRPDPGPRRGPSASTPSRASPGWGHLYMSDTGWRSPHGRSATFVPLGAGMTNGPRYRCVDVLRGRPSCCPPHTAPAAASPALPVLLPVGRQPCHGSRPPAGRGPGHTRQAFGDPPPSGRPRSRSLRFFLQVAPHKAPHGEVLAGPHLTEQARAAIRFVTQPWMIRSVVSWKAPPPSLHRTTGGGPAAGRGARAD